MEITKYFGCGVFAGGMKEGLDANRGHDDGSGKCAVEENGTEIAGWEDISQHSGEDTPLIRRFV